MKRTSDPTTQAAAAADATGREIVITRTFAAPLPQVFEAWTEPEHLRRWWGPRGFTLPVCEVELRARGAFRFTMRGPDGTEYPFAGVYEEIAPLERLVFTGEIHDGNEARTTVSFAAQGRATTVTVQQRYGFVSEATRGAPVGWSQSLDRLEALLTR